MTDPLRYDATAAHQLLPDRRIERVSLAVENARKEVQEDVKLTSVPPEKQPLDAGFITWPEELLDKHASNNGDDPISRILEAAGVLREQTDSVVSLGIGGSYMGARALMEALCDPYHNELSRTERGGTPRFYFDGANVDNDSTSALLNLLKARGTAASSSDPLQQWGLIVISKSGGTLETAVAFRLFRQALEEYHRNSAERCRELIVPVTGKSGKLRCLSTSKGYARTFPVEDGIGGRFSVLTAVGLLPAAVLGLDIVKLLQGAAEMTERFRKAQIGNNPVLDYVVTCHLFEKDCGRNIRVLSTWGNRLEAIGLWYDQLLSESLGKDERGATPITGVNTRDLHSRGQQHQEGTHDKLITNLYVESGSSDPLPIPKTPDTEDHDELNRFAGKTVPDALSAGRLGTNKAYADVDRPTADIALPQLNEHAIGQLLQMLMLATAVEGRLIGINPYGQPGVEAYKQNMLQILSGQVP